MSTGAWIAWGIALVIAVAALVVAILAWRRPKTPPPLPQIPPDLTLEQVGDLGSGSGSPREHVKAKLRLVNEGRGVARHWQVSIINPAGPTLKVARAPYRGPLMVSEAVTWNQDASTGEIPGDQDRDLADWLWVEAPPDMGEVALSLEIMAEGMQPKNGDLVVIFPSGGGPALRFEI